jgi:trk system potassium uptake protein TrkA
MNVVIVGGGKVGTYLARLLLAEKHQVKLVELRDEEQPRLAGELPENSFVIGSGTDPSILETAGIRKAQVVAAVTGSDEINLVVASLARFEFMIPRIIGRVNNPKNTWLYTPEMGVDVAINQADLMAHLIAEEMSLGDMMTLLKLRKGQYSLIEEKVHPSSVVVNKALRDVALPEECVLTAIIRKGDLLIPHGDIVFQPADEVIALVHASRLKAVADMLSR